MFYGVDRNDSVVTSPKGEGFTFPSRSRKSNTPRKSIIQTIVDLEEKYDIKPNHTDTPLQKLYSLREAGRGSEDYLNLLEATLLDVWLSQEEEEGLEEDLENAPSMDELLEGFKVEGDFSSTRNSLDRDGFDLDAEVQAALSQPDQKDALRMVNDAAKLACPFFTYAALISEYYKLKETVNEASPEASTSLAS